VNVAVTAAPARRSQIRIVNSADGIGGNRQTSSGKKGGERQKSDPTRHGFADSGAKVCRPPN